MRCESREFAYLLMETAGRPRHVVEVGAFQSDDLVCWPFVFDPKCRIQLIEPNPDRALELRSAYADFPNIELHECAIAPRNGPVTLRVPKNLASSPFADASAFVSDLPGSPYQSRAQAGASEELVSVQVQGRTFDVFDDGSIQGLVIDTEGSEWHVLERLRSRPLVICVEMEGPSGYRNPFFDRIEAWMRTESYQRHSIEHIIHAEGTVPTDHVYVQKNLVGDNHQLLRAALPPENYFAHLLRTLWKR